MSQIPVTIKIDADLKAEAQLLAKSLGLSLSAIVENKLRQAVRERRIVFEETPALTQQTAQMLDEIVADVRSGKNLSNPFATYDELEKHLNSL